MPPSANPELLGTMLVGSRRALPEIKLNASVSGDNPGLLLERYLKNYSQPNDKKEPSARTLLLEKVAKTQISESYRRAFERWRDTLRGMPNVTLLRFTVSPDQRLIVGLGSASVLEVSVTLNRIYGVPMIPGSALKGLARHYFTQQIEGNSDKTNYMHDLFGTTDSASFFTFFDAWYIPGPAKDDCPLQLDIMTPHHPEYYARKTSCPTDFDDPIPISFLSAVGEYLVVLQGPTSDWNTFAFSLLQKALLVDGIGGKTSSGYGRGKLSPYDDKSTSLLPATPAPIVQKILDQPSSWLRDNIKTYNHYWKKMGGSEKIEFASAVLKKIEEGELRNDKNFIALPIVQEMLECSSKA